MALYIFLLMVCNTDYVLLHLFAISIQPVCRQTDIVQESRNILGGLFTYDIGIIP